MAKVNLRRFDKEKLVKECLYLAGMNELLTEQNESLSKDLDTYKRLAHDLSNQVSVLQGIAPMRKAS